MKNTITAMFLTLFASAAFAQAVSASYEIPAEDVSAPSVNSQDVSATATASDVSAPYMASDVKDGRRPAPSLSACCGVPVSASYDSRVSSPQVAKQADDSDSFAMAGLGFGLFGLVGLTKLARRKSKSIDKM